MNSKLLIIESQYLVNYNNPEQGITVGGSQRYALALAELFIKLDYNILLVCKGNHDCLFKYNEFNIKVLKAPYGNKGNYIFSKRLYKFCVNQNPNLVCYSDLQIGAYYCYNNSFALQHGIAWDTPFSKIKKNILKRTDLRSIKKFKKIICVDTNYINWLRSVSKFYFNNPKNFVYIPNFANQQLFNYNYKNWEKNVFPLLYPRRLVFQRGFTIFTEMCKKLLKQGYNIIPVYTIEKGSDISIIKDQYENNTKIEIINPYFNEMPKYYKESFLSFIPTIWSEGTSLSAIESISCGCPVIASNVGGLGNIVIPGYNGQIISPNIDEFVEYTKMYLNNISLRNIQSKNCKNISEVFSLDNWEKRIKKALETLIN